MPEQNDLRYLRVAGQVFDTPLLLSESQGLLIGEYLAARMLGQTPPEPLGNRFTGEEAFEVGPEGLEWQGYARIGPVARINLMGETVNRGAWMGAHSGLTSYEGFSEQMRRAASDPEVSSILLDVDSPGGAVAGMFETSRLVKQAAERKPVIAVVNALAASAGYGLISGATKVVMTESASAGSIGVLMVHLDRSEALEQMGVKATVFHAGAKKVQGHPLVPLDEDAKASIQMRVNSIMDRFTALLAEHRGIPAQSLKDLEAGILFADEAIDAGLADEIGTFDEVLEDLSRAPQGRIISSARRPDMSAINPVPEPSGITQEQMDSAVAAAHEEGITAGAASERERIKAILGGEAAKGREALAQHFAFETGQSPEEANAALEKSPKAAAPEAEADFDDRKDRAAADAGLDLGGPAAVPQQKTGLTLAVDRQIGRSH